MGLFKKFSDGLKKTRDSMLGAIESVANSLTAIDESLLEELEEILIMADVGMPTAKEICTRLRRRIKETGTTDPKAVKALLQGVIEELLKGESALDISHTPAVVLIIGVNGVGKTTTIGKLAANLRAQGKRVLIAAADTFRAAAIEQLEIWAKRAGADFVKHSEGADPAAVIFDAIGAGKARGVDVILCDTAGRLHNKKHLMDELAKISRVISRELPESSLEVLLVLDATTGQNAIHQARNFKEATGLTGIVLTKLDGTAKGGVVIGIKQELGIPIKYIGVGEQVDDLREFDAAQFAAALFGERETALGKGENAI